MVGGRSPLARDERLYRFVFPERPGALMRFLSSMPATLEHQPLPLPQPGRRLRPHPGRHAGAAGRRAALSRVRRRPGLSLRRRDREPRVPAVPRLRTRRRSALTASAVLSLARALRRLHVGRRRLRRRRLDRRCRRRGGIAGIGAPFSAARRAGRAGCRHRHARGRRADGSTPVAGGGSAGSSSSMLRAPWAGPIDAVRRPTDCSTSPLSSRAPTANALAGLPSTAISARPLPATDCSSFERGAITPTSLNRDGACGLRLGGRDDDHRRAEQAAEIAAHDGRLADGDRIRRRLRRAGRRGGAARTRPSPRRATRSRMPRCRANMRRLSWNARRRLASER